MGQLVDQFLRLPILAKFGLTIMAALLFSLLLARQAGVAMDRAAAMGATIHRRLPWFILAIGTLVSFGEAGSILWPSVIVSRGSPGNQWMGLFIAFAVWFAAVQLVIRGRTRS